MNAVSDIRQLTPLRELEGFGFSLMVGYRGGSWNNCSNLSVWDANVISPFGVSFSYGGGGSEAIGLRGRLGGYLNACQDNVFEFVN